MEFWVGAALHVCDIHSKILPHPAQGALIITSLIMMQRLWQLKYQNNNLSSHW